MNSTAYDQMFAPYGCLKYILYGLTLTTNEINKAEDDLCWRFRYAERILTHHTLRPTIFLVLLINMIISIYKNKTENFKIIIFHASTTNFIVMVFHQADFINQVYLGNKLTLEATRNVYEVMYYLINISRLSFFPLAVNRFSSLYFPRFYDKFFNRIGITISLLSYDVLIIILFIINKHLLGLSSIETYVKFFIMFIDLVFSVMLFAKIRSMINLASKSHDRKILDELYRVAIVCILHALIFIVFLFYAALGDIFYNIVKQDPYFFRAYLFLYMYELCCYEVVLLIDSLLVLFALKTYRIPFLNFCGRCLNRTGLYKREGSKVFVTSTLSGRR